AVAVDRIGGTGEVGVEDVAKELAADRATTARRADHGQRSWSEERSQRGDDADVVTRLDPESQLARRRDREPQLDLAALELARELEAGVRKHARGVRIAGADDGDEFGDAGGPGAASGRGCSSSSRFAT